MQVVGTSVFSGILLGEWRRIVEVVMGVIAMMLLVVGICLR